MKGKSQSFQLYKFRFQCNNSQQFYIQYFSLSEKLLQTVFISLFSIPNCSCSTSCHISWVVLELGVFIHFGRIAVFAQKIGNAIINNVDGLPQAHFTDASVLV